MRYTKFKIVSLETPHLNKLKVSFLSAIQRINPESLYGFSTVISPQIQSLEEDNIYKEMYPRGEKVLHTVYAFAIKYGLDFRNQTPEQIASNPKNYLFKVPTLNLLKISAEDLLSFLQNTNNWTIRHDQPQEEDIPINKNCSPNEVIEQLQRHFDISSTLDPIILQGIKGHADTTCNWHLDGEAIYLKNGTLITISKDSKSRTITLSEHPNGTEYLQLPVLNKLPDLDQEQLKHFFNLLYKDIIPSILNNPANQSWITPHIQRLKTWAVYDGVGDNYFHRTPHVDDEKRIHIII